MTSKGPFQPNAFYDSKHSMKTRQEDALGVAKVLTSANAPPDIPVYGSQTHVCERWRWVCHEQEGGLRSLG